jgi:hypothetical protein
LELSRPSRFAGACRPVLTAPAHGRLSVSAWPGRGKALCNRNSLMAAEANVDRFVLEGSESRFASFVES